MKKLCITIPVFNQLDTLNETINSYYENAKYKADISLTIIDNGSNPPISKSLAKFWIKYPYVNINVYRFENNVGVARALNKGYELTKTGCCPADFIMFTHSDVLIEEPEWDVKLFNTLDRISNIGVIGFGGAKGIGSPDIYLSPYSIWQLARRGFVSNMRDAEQHGRRMVNEIEPAVVLDGFTLICNSEMLDVVGGFDEHYIFHNYDNDLCIRAILEGYHNFVLNVKCHHKGGITSTRSDYDEWLRKQDINGDSEVHKESHTYMYEKFRGNLPIYIRGNNLTKGSNE